MWRRFTCDANDDCVGAGRRGALSTRIFSFINFESGGAAELVALPEGYFGANIF